MSSPSHEVVVVDNNAPWVRSFFEAMPEDVRVHNLRVVSLGLPGMTYGQLARRAFRTAQTAPGHTEQLVVIPGWSKAFGLSTAIIRQRVKSILKRLRGTPTVVAWTDPHYVDVMDSIHDVKHAYYAHDVFRFYGWGGPTVTQWEKRMLEKCDAVFAVAKALKEDFEALHPRRVVHSPMAVSSSFLARLDAPLAAPADLPAGGPPVVGCVGQMNDSYNWPMIARMSELLPNIKFVFIGPVIEADPAKKSAIEAVLHRSNIQWLGPRPHAELPAYLNRFDICLNPMRVDPHNDRRSPLRFFDYIATSRPILSTPIRETEIHAPFLEIADTAERAAALITRMLAPGYTVNTTLRKQYIRNNTWEARAAEFLREVFPTT